MFALYTAMHGVIGSPLFGSSTQKDLFLNQFFKSRFELPLAKVFVCHLKVLCLQQSV